ncbi:hypothetical protein QZH41_013713 [Actinostola sp. cb2023]|nr:hypothetical protein QZH41_013713 [Actinostola sp. cb2023]
MAYLLKKKGFANVVVLEKENRTGGKLLSVKQKGVFHDLGACVMESHTYSSVIALKTGAKDAMDAISQFLIINATFRYTVLKQHELLALVPVLTFHNTWPGYWYLDTVSALEYTGREQCLDAKIFKELIHRAASRTTLTTVAYRRRAESHPLKFMEHFVDRVGAENIDIINDTTWDYFYRFSVDEMADGILWNVADYQGTRNTWYIGSSVCFEATKNVIELIQSTNDEKNGNVKRH